MSFGERLKQRRQECRLTMEALAVLVGTSRQTIQRYESGKISRPPYEKIEALAAALSTTPGDLMGWRGSEEAELTADGEPEEAVLFRVSYVTVPDDAMAGDRILERDTVYYRPTEEVEPGQILVGYLDGQVLVRRRYDLPDGVLLLASNTAFEPIVLTGEGLRRLRVLGCATVLKTLL